MILLNIVYPSHVPLGCVRRHKKRWPRRDVGIGCLLLCDEIKITSRVATPMSALGPRQTYALQKGMSAFPPKAHAFPSLTSGRQAPLVGKDLRRWLGQPTRTNVSSGSAIANSYVPHGLSSGAFLPRSSPRNSLAQKSTSSI